MQGPATRRFGAFELNLQSGELRKNRIRLRLSGQPLQVLAVLIEQAAEVVTREELHSKLWNADTFVDFDHGLNNAVARIREVLNDSSDTPRSSRRSRAEVTASSREYRSSAASAPDVKTEIETDAPARPPKKLQPAFYSAPRGNEIRPIKPKTFPCGSLRACPACRGFRDLPSQRCDGTANQISSRITSRKPVWRSRAGISSRWNDGGTRRPPRQPTRCPCHFPHLIDAFQGHKTIYTGDRVKALGVDALVEGSVIREGSHLRVHAQLIRATDEHFWSESYDREMGDVLALESEVAQSIAEKVAVTVTGQEQARLATARHISPEVYEAYLKGKSRSA